jgi:hypothetical protein
LWDTAKECFSNAGYNGNGFTPVWDTPQNTLRMFDEFSWNFFAVSLILEQFSFRFFVSHTAKESLVVYPTVQQVLFRCRTQQRKIIYCTVIFLSFKCLSLTSDENLGKSGYLTNPLRDWEMLIYTVSIENKNSYVVEYTAGNFSNF